MTITILVADNGFTCLKKGQKCPVFFDPHGYDYVRCQQGRHYLEGQRKDGKLIGFTEKAKAQPRLKEAKL